MKKLILFSIALIILASSMTCEKKTCTVVVEETTLVPSNTSDSITYYPFDRDDLSPPPTELWWTIDTSNLDDCQSRLWGYLKRMYPNREEDYWDYEIYSLMNEPEEVFENRAFMKQFFDFFNDTMYVQTLQDTLMPCANVDSTFFLQALGQPTCKSYGYIDGRTNYFYYFKLRYRSGPCPYIFNEGSEVEHHCQMNHFEYCHAGMKIFFDETTGMMIYIDFLMG